jgi:hypothetical protein
MARIKRPETTPDPLQSDSFDAPLADDLRRFVNHAVDLIVGLEKAQAELHANAERLSKVDRTLTSAVWAAERMTRDGIAVRLDSSISAAETRLAAAVAGPLSEAQKTAQELRFTAALSAMFGAVTGAAAVIFFLHVFPF